MSEDDLRSSLRRETDPLAPDVASIVRGASARGRRRRRRATVGTSAATVLVVGAVAAGAALLGPGISVHTNGIDAASAGVVDSAPGSHGTSHRTPQGPSTISRHLADLLPGSDGDAPSLVSVAGSAGQPGDTGLGQTLATSVSWHGGFVNLELSDDIGPTTTTVTVDPSNGAISSPGPRTHGSRASTLADPEQACRADAARASTVTQPCHEVDNGDWAYASTGLDTDEYLIATPADAPAAVAVSPGVQPGGSAGYSSSLTIQDDQGSPVAVPSPGEPSPVATVTLFTSDAWRIMAWASAPSPSGDPVLGADDLQALTQDGGWFLAPGQTPSAEPVPTTGPACDPCEVTSATPAQPTSDRSPVAARDLADVFASLLPGKVSDVVVDNASADSPAASFTWNGYAVKVALGPRQLGTCGQPTPDGACSNTGDLTSGSQDGPEGQATGMGATHVSKDGWSVNISVSGLDAKADLTSDQLATAASSDTWFH